MTDPKLPLAPAPKPDWDLLLEMAARQDNSKAEQERLFKIVLMQPRSDPWVLRVNRALASNPMTSPGILIALANTASGAHEELAANPNFPVTRYPALFYTRPRSALQNPSLGLWLLENPNFVKELITYRAYGVSSEPFVRLYHTVREVREWVSSFDQRVWTFEKMRDQAHKIWETEAREKDRTTRSYQMEIGIVVFSNSWPKRIIEYAHDIWLAQSTTSPGYKLYVPPSGEVQLLADLARVGQPTFCLSDVMGQKGITTLQGLLRYLGD